MKPIKFRVWDKRNKTFIYDAQNGDQNNTFADFLHYDCYVVQQFTGFIDRNNKDIYEGDILLYRLSYEEVMTNQGENEIDVIIFENGSFRLKNGDHLFELINYHGNCKLDEEIIGNIFENPELL